MSSLVSSLYRRTLATRTRTARGNSAMHARRSVHSSRRVSLRRIRGAILMGSIWVADCAVSIPRKWESKWHMRTEMCGKTDTLLTWDRGGVVGLPQVKLGGREGVETRKERPK